MQPEYFNITVKIFLHTKFTSTHLILYRTYQSLSGSQTFSPDWHFRTVNTEISPPKYFFPTSTKSAQPFKICLTVIISLHATQTGGQTDRRTHTHTHIHTHPELPPPLFFSTISSRCRQLRKVCWHVTNKRSLQCQLGRCHPRLGKIKHQTELPLVTNSGMLTVDQPTNRCC